MSEKKTFDPFPLCVLATLISVTLSIILATHYSFTVKNPYTQAPVLITGGISFVLAGVTVYTWLRSAKPILFPPKENEEGV